jgi:hypothetical protein
MTEEPDTTFGGLLPEHVNVFFPPTRRKPWGGGVKSIDYEGRFITYPLCKYCKDLIRCSHPKRRFGYCDTHNHIGNGGMETECPINGIPEGEE